MGYVNNRTAVANSIIWRYFSPQHSAALPDPSLNTDICPMRLCILFHLSVFASSPTELLFIFLLVFQGLESLLHITTHRPQERSPEEHSLCIIQKTRAGETMILTECTCSIPTATTTRTWRRLSPTHPQSTTAPRLMDWNPPPTMWTFMLAHGGLPTGQSSTLALLTPGYRSGGASCVTIKNLSSLIYHLGAGRHESTNRLFHELGFISVFVLKWMSVYGGRVQLSDGRWKDGMCAKEGNQGMFFFFN